MGQPIEHDDNDAMARIEQLQGEIDALRAQLREQRGQSDEHDAKATRRNILKLAAGAAAGSVAAVAIGSGRAAATDPQDLDLGETNLTPNLTEATHTGAQVGASFLFQSGDVWDPASAAFPCALAGWSNTDNRPTGVYAWTSATDGNGTVAYAVGTGGTGLVAFGNRANVRLVSAGAAPAARTDAHTAGELIADSAGAVWYCTASGTPGTWRKLASTSTAGAFHAIDPIRVFDSRLAAYAPANGLFPPNTNRVVSVKDARDGAGAVVTTDAVPAGATAVSYNVTITGTTGPNFLSVTPGDSASFTTSTINWSGTGDSLANGSIVKVDASRQVRIFCGDQTGSTHVIFDITGYFL